MQKMEDSKIKDKELENCKLQLAKTDKTLHKIKHLKHNYIRKEYLNHEIEKIAKKLNIKDAFCISDIENEIISTYNVSNIMDELNYLVDRCRENDEIIKTYEKYYESQTEDGFVIKSDIIDNDNCQVDAKYTYKGVEYELFTKKFHQDLAKIEEDEKLEKDAYIVSKPWRLLRDKIDDQIDKQYSIHAFSMDSISDPNIKSLYRSINDKKTQTLLKEKLFCIWKIKFTVHTLLNLYSYYKSLGYTVDDSYDSSNNPICDDSIFLNIYIDNKYILPLLNTYESSNPSISPSLIFNFLSEFNSPSLLSHSSKDDSSFITVQQLFDSFKSKFSYKLTLQDFYLIISPFISSPLSKYRRTLNGPIHEAYPLPFSLIHPSTNTSFLDNFTIPFSSNPSSSSHLSSPQLSPLSSNISSPSHFSSPQLSPISPSDSSFFDLDID